MNKAIAFIIGLLFFKSYTYSQCACCAGAGTGSSNGDYNNGIITLTKKQLVAETYGDYRTIKSVSDHAQHEDAQDEETPLKSMVITSIGLRYGVTDKLTVSALLPYVFLHTTKGNDKGVGDLILLGTLNVFSKNNFSIAAQAGAELPTGVQKDANFDNTTVVVGSGSVDPMAGIMASKRWPTIAIQANYLYKYTTRGFEKTNYGSVSVQNLSLTYRLFGNDNFCSIDSSSKSTNALGLNISAGYYGEWLGKIKDIEKTDENSGYYLGFATIGTNLVFNSWSFPLTLSIPVIQNVNGTQNNVGARVRLGVIKSF